MSKLLLVIPPPTFKCWATESEGDVELLATLFNRSIEDDFSKSRDADRSKSSDADLSLPAEDPESSSIESISSFTYKKKR